MDSWGSRPKRVGPGSLSLVSHLLNHCKLHARKAQGGTCWRDSSSTAGNAPRIPEDSKQLAGDLFTAAVRAWNLLTPRKCQFECKEIEIPQMSVDPKEVPIICWLRSDSEDCPESLQCLVLLRELLESHNNLLNIAMNSAEMRDEARPAPCCLADALRPYFLHYEPGSLWESCDWVEVT